MKKIIIEILDSTGPHEAMMLVSEVIKGGKISETAKHKIKHYCWLTVFRGRGIVSVRQKKNHDSPDSFMVYQAGL